MGEHVRIGALLMVVACACAVERGPLSTAGGAATAGDASGDGGSSATGGTGSSGGAAATSGTGGAGGMAATGGVSGSGIGGGGIGAAGGVGGSAVLDAGLDAGPLGYEPGRVGAPCRSGADCQANRTERTCITQELLQPLLTLPGGYCSTFCDLGLSCETGSACITIPTFPPTFACMRQCVASEECRQAEGYTCNKPFTSSVAVCSLAL